MWSPYSSKTTDLIVGILAFAEPLTATEIQCELEKLGHFLKTSGLYKALALLRGQGVLLKVRGQFQINNEWKQSVYKMLGGYGTLTLEDGESITFACQTASQTDKYWKHYSLILEREASETDLYFYNPHQFWLYIPDRAQSEKEYIDYTKDKKLRVKHLISNTTMYDKSFARTYTNSTYEIYCTNIKTFSKRDNIAVFGDYILNTKTSTTFADYVNRIYTEAESEKELADQIADVVMKPDRFIFKLEKNRNLARKLKKVFKKYF